MNLEVTASFSDRDIGDLGVNCVELCCDTVDLDILLKFFVGRVALFLGVSRESTDIEIGRVLMLLLFRFPKFSEEPSKQKVNAKSLCISMAVVLELVICFGNRIRSR